MAELLKLIEQGQARDSREARQREAAFAQAKNQQQSLLNQARAERNREESTSASLEQQFEQNQQQIITARQALDERLGALKELFGVLQTVSGDTQGRFSNVADQHPVPGPQPVPVRPGCENGRGEQPRVDRGHRGALAYAAAGDLRVRSGRPIQSPGHAGQWRTGRDGGSPGRRVQPRFACRLPRIQP